MEVFWIVFTAVVSGGLGWLLTYLFEKSPKVIAYYGHTATFNVLVPSVQTDREHVPQEQSVGSSTLRVNTHSIVIRNTGRRPARNLRLGHNYLPNVEVIPQIPHAINDLTNGGKEIVFPNFVPGREIAVSYLYYAPLTFNDINTFIESDEGPVSVVPVQLVRYRARWVTIAFSLFAAIGLLTALSGFTLLVVRLIGIFNA